MSRERQLGGRRENAHARGVRLVLRLQHEHRLRQVELARDGLHRRRIQPVGVEHDRQRVAAEPLVGEDIENVIVEAHVRLPRLPESGALCRIPRAFQAASASGRDEPVSFRISSSYLRNVVNGSNLGFATANRRLRSPFAPASPQPGHAAAGTQRPRPARAGLFGLGRKGFQLARSVAWHVRAPRSLGIPPNGSAERQRLRRGGRAPRASAAPPAAGAARPTKDAP